MSSLHTDEIQAYLNELYGAGKSYSTRKKIKDALNDCCRRTVKVGELKTNPIDGIVVKKEKKSERKKLKDEEVPYYPPEEEAKLIKAATSHFKTGRPRFRLGWAIPFVLNTGIRVGELAALKWSEHVDLEERSITI